MDVPDGRMCVVVEIEGKCYKGVGFNSKTAKCAAAKYALRDFATADWVLSMYLFCLINQEILTHV